MSQSIFLNPEVTSAPVLTGAGNGTLTVDRLSHFTIDQDYTVTCTAVDPFTVFQVVGSLDGAVGVAVVGTQFVDQDSKVFFTIQQGPNLFEIGDVFEFSVGQGTDLTQENIDSYDELPQKNFGTGVVGQDKGDHNLRRAVAALLAKKTIQDLIFTSKIAGQPGNEISIIYLAGSVLTAASKVIQDLTYTAQAAGSAGNDIQIEYLDTIAAVASQRDIQGIRYFAQTAGVAGDNISITYVGGGTAGAESVNVVGNDIEVTIEDGVSTVDNIRSAIIASGPAFALVDPVAIGADADPQNTQVQTFLQGGADAIGDAGNEVVTVDGNLIQVRLENGVSTATQVETAINGSAPALALVSVAVTGAGATAQTSPVAPTNLENGADNVGDPGNEIVTVDDKQITVTFKDGASTAAQIKTAIEGEASADALVTVALGGTGTELQNSPVGEQFLQGGLAQHGFALNKEELTVPGSFFEGNGDFLVKDQTIQGLLQVIKQTLMKGKLSLEDTVAANLSGPQISNVQKTINDGFSNQKMFVRTLDDSSVFWNADDLTFSSSISIYLVNEGIQNRVDVGQSPITILDGEHLYVTLDRTATAIVAPIVSTSVPVSENSFRLASRVGNSLFWFDNTIQFNNTNIKLGSPYSDPEYDAVVGGPFATHSDINAVMNDANFALLKNILVAESLTVNTTQEINKDGVTVIFKPQVEYTKGTATKGLLINANRVRIYGGRFKDFNVGGDFAVEVSATSKNTMLRDVYFNNNNGQELNDLGQQTDYTGLMVEV